MLPTPTQNAAAECVGEFQGREKYRLAEESLSLLFSQWPANDELRVVQLKVVALNSMYSTQIYDTYSVSRHVHQLDIDSDLRAGNLDLVERIAHAPVGEKGRFNLSFASKYCSWHMPEYFAIFDSYVEEALWRYRKEYEFDSFRRKDLRTYAKFIQALKKFSDTFGLNSLSMKELDQYLWIVGERLRAA